MSAKRRVEDAEVRKIQDVPKGEYVKLIHGKAWTKKVYSLGDYDRSFKQWELHDEEDISRNRWVNSNKLVLVGFTY